MRRVLISQVFRKTTQTPPLRAALASPTRASAVLSGQVTSGIKLFQEGMATHPINRENVPSPPQTPGQEPGLGPRQPPLWCLCVALGVSGT